MGCRFLIAIATQRFTLNDYLAYDDGTAYELVNGELVRKPFLSEILWKPKADFKYASF
ncbi:hypothetical protein N836_19285 [Leptolyngbya sp. Heron Island J]|uniref:hypothetical protein n=1 Tax=Leptolyngbya sp. Heron Island J TaxID=1385935 RepID=UPI0003B9D3DC|nr:hypothetical protein [Leptolyngbya sp. Heron Island J]ESA34017.1 hypothetical protein N836_19285 [Leptolyngbya sp. Heron Island J]